MVELLVWAAVAFLVLSAATYFFVRLLFYTRTGLVRGESHGNASMVMSRLTQELSQANASGLAWHETGDPPTEFILSIHPQNASNEHAQSLFQTKLRLYRWDSDSRQVLWREDGSMPLSPLVPFRPTSVQLQTLSGGARSQWRLVGDQIVAFRVRNVDDTLGSGRVQNLLLIEVAAASASPHREFRLTSTVAVPTSY